MTQAMFLLLNGQYFTMSVLQKIWRCCLAGFTEAGIRKTVNRFFTNEQRCLGTVE
jgi:hypothetical protein